MLYRGYRIEPLGTFAMYRIRAQGQGQVPAELSGHYTTEQLAKKAVDSSLQRLVKRRKPNVPKESTATP